MTEIANHRTTRRSFNRFKPESFSSFDQWQDGYVAPPVVVQKDPSELRVLELKRPFVTPAGIVLPPRDCEGFKHGKRYEALLRARTPSKATRTTTPGVKIKRRFEALSLNELRIQLALMFSPYVVDLREQYGRFSMDAYNRATTQGKKMLRSQVMTIDLIATLVCPETGRLKNHGISIKPEGYVPDEEALAREERERESMHQAGWTWELLLGNEVGATEYSNYGVLFSLVQGADLPTLYKASRRFALTLLTVSDRGCLLDVVGRASTQLAIPMSRANKLFATAVAYGFLTLDHRAPLRTDEPLFLIR
ncbi:hypothetical protein [Caballeronia sp. ATUFL_M2_KS44]|uniref:hypothetical protein n=1 Tax=Caballeronia sp. ATUFL_M2_KS44 TaxID=2921767 RepID=UPI0020279BBC|nr:hypothetical protein [Caballeronia sp. ATUFL_M2_KS44]